MKPDQTQLQLALIPHEIENTLIHQRAIDGYVNATAMCKAVGKLLNNYTRTATTQEFLQELSAVTRKSVTELVITIQGGRPELQGTWVHPHVAINLGQWCSPKFAVAVAQWVQDWFSGNIKPASLPYHVQRYIANRSEIPPTHFSVLNEMIYGLIGPLECAGHIVSESILPDISMGKMFCRWLREEKNIDTDALPRYNHTYADGRCVPARLYPNELLADFRRHFHEVWLPTKAATYFKDRDPKALEYLPKLLPYSRN